MTYLNSKSQAGRLALVSIGPVAGTATPTFVHIGEVASSNINGAQYDFEDVSNFDSGVYKEFISLMIDPGTLDLEINRVSSDAGQAAVQAAFASGGLYMFKLQYPLNAQAGQTTAGDIEAFNAFVMSSDVTIQTNKAIKLKVKLKKSGATSFTAGS